MRRFLLLWISFEIAMSACKPSDESTETKSFFGIQSAKISYIQSKADAPRFVALAKWFDTQIVGPESASNGNKMKISSAEKIVSDTPNAYKAGVLAYIDQQLGRADDLLAASKLDSSAGEEKIKRLLYLESTEMMDIIRILLLQAAEPLTDDLLVRLLFESRKNSNFVEDFANPYFEMTFPADSKEQLYQIEKRLTEERDSFSAALIRYYLKVEPRATLIADIKKTQSLLYRLKQQFSGKPGLALAGSAAGEPILVTGPIAGFLNFQHAFLTDRRQMAGFGLQEQGSSAAGPSSLGILAQDENISGTGPTASGSGPVNPMPITPETLPPVTVAQPVTQQNIPTAMPAPNGTLDRGGLYEILKRLLDPNWFNSGISLRSARQKTEGDAITPPPYNCLGKGFSGRTLLDCQRFYAYANVPNDPASAMSRTAATWKPAFGLTAAGSRGNFSIVRETAAIVPVKYQGQKPSCTAYGTAQTIEAQVRQTVDAEQIWVNQGQDMMLDSSIRAATALYPDYRINATPVASVGEIVAAIDRKVPVAISIPAGQDWFVNGGGSEFTLTNNSGLALQGQGNVPNRVGCTTNGNRHIISLQGYAEVDGKMYFLIKNSWGSQWRDNGYAMLDWDTCGPTGLAQRGLAVQAGK